MRRGSRVPAGTHLYRSRATSQRRGGDDSVESRTMASNDERQNAVTQVNLKGTRIGQDENNHRTSGGTAAGQGRRGAPSAAVCLVTLSSSPLDPHLISKISPGSIRSCQDSQRRARDGRWVQRSVAEPPGLREFSLRRRSLTTTSRMQTWRAPDDRERALEYEKRRMHELEERKVKASLSCHGK